MRTGVLGMLVQLLLTLTAVSILVPPAGYAAEPADQPGQIEKVFDAFPQGLKPDQIDALLAVMDDDAMRRALRGYLAEDHARRQALAPAERNVLELYQRRLGAVAAAYPHLPQQLKAAFERPSGEDAPLSLSRLVLTIVFLLGLGTVAMLATRRGLAGRRQRIERTPATGWGNIIARTLLRIVLEVAEIAAFLLAIVLVYLILSPSHPAAPAILFMLLNAALVVLVVAKLSDAVLDPQAPERRLVPIGDREAVAVRRAIVVTTVLVVSVVAISRLLVELGMSRDEVNAFALPLSLLPFAYLLWLVVARHGAITQYIAARLQLDLTRLPLLGAWPLVACLYLIGLWLTIVDAALRGETGIGPRALASLIMVLALPLLALLVHRPLAKFYGLDPGHAAATAVDTSDPAPLSSSAPPQTPTIGPALAPRPDRRQAAEAHVRRLMRAVWAVLVVLVVIVTGWLFGFRFETTTGIGGAAFRILFDVGAVVLLGYVGWALIERAIDRGLERSRAGSDASRAQRIATLLPLLRKFLQVVLLVMIAMVVLASLGIEIGPLLAGAGVLGLAIGLGAQATIADILAGVFFLLENAFHVGDYVEVGDLRGEVESISLRSLKLRHHRGAVHTLPFGQIPSLTNYSRDWALIRLEFRVAPDTDLALVKKLIKEIAKQLADDPELGPDFIQPLKSQGVRSIEDNAVILGVKYIARPGRQFLIRREAYQRIRDAFLEHGIQLVGREVTVRVETADAEDIGAAGAAAADALEQAEPG